MTNNPKKVQAFIDVGVDVVDRIPHETGRNPHNQKYLETNTGNYLPQKEWIMIIN